jgi:hypothetical protein
MMNPLIITRLDTRHIDFTAQLKNVLAWDESSDFEIHLTTVRYNKRMNSKWTTPP